METAKPQYSHVLKLTSRRCNISMQTASKEHLIPCWMRTKRVLFYFFNVPRPLRHPEPSLTSDQVTLLERTRAMTSAAVRANGWYPSWNAAWIPVPTERNNERNHRVRCAGELSGCQVLLAVSSWYAAV